MSSSGGSLRGSPLPEAGHDPGDPSNPSVWEDKDTPAPPIADPTNDMDHDLSDNESVLSEIDDAQFEDFDPANIEIDERPAIAVDEDTVKLLGRHKRKRDGAEGGASGVGADGEVTKKKKKEGKREKPKKSRKKRDDDDGVFDGNEEMEGRRSRKKRAAPEDGGEKRDKAQARVKESTPDENLSPEERRRRALDRAMDIALKNPNRRRRRMDGIDVNNMIDEEIATIRQRMAEAAEKDVQARSADPPRPAMHKLKLLPEVVALLNRNGREIENAIVDPENNLLESVRFFLEPLNDGSLPAYNIQRELFAALVKLPINNDALISSGVGKVVLFYTKSKKPELAIKRQAERLLAEWTRPILKRSDNYRNRVLEEKEYDPVQIAQRQARAARAVGSQVPLETQEQRRARELALPTRANRTKFEEPTKTYTIVPRPSGQVMTGAYAKPVGAGGDAALRRIKARQLAAQGKAPRR